MTGETTCRIYQTTTQHVFVYEVTKAYSIRKVTIQPILKVQRDNKMQSH